MKLLPYDQTKFHAFACGVSCCAFVILLITTILLFTGGFIVPACVGWALSLIALCLIIHHRSF